MKNVKKKTLKVKPKRPEGRPKKPGGPRFAILKVSIATREKIKKVWGSVDNWGQVALLRTGIIKDEEQH